MTDQPSELFRNPLEGCHGLQYTVTLCPLYPQTCSCLHCDISPNVPDCNCRPFKRPTKTIILVIDYCNVYLRSEEAIRSPRDYPAETSKTVYRCNIPARTTATGVRTADVKESDVFGCFQELTGDFLLPFFKIGDIDCDDLPSHLHYLFGTERCRDSIQSNRNLFKDFLILLPASGFYIRIGVRNKCNRCPMEHVSTREHT